MSGFEGFTEDKITVRSTVLHSDIEIYCRKAGSGPALLLLHGFPQTHYIWAKIAKRLSEKYTVVVTDLRGYGQSSKPKGSDDHVEYSKKEMAHDQVQVMKNLGFDEFFLVGHDRGGRVAHRLALDFPQCVKKLLLLDIAPTLWMYEATDMMFAAGYWHWFFLIQPSPGPEQMILSGTDAFWDACCRRIGRAMSVWTDEANAAYKSQYFTPEAVHSTCEDYRASATIDLAHDRADRAAGHKLAVPAVRVIWGGNGLIGKMGKGDPVAVWKDYAEAGVDVSGRESDCGHYIPEEKPEELYDEICAFMV